MSAKIDFNNVATSCKTLSEGDLFAVIFPNEMAEETMKYIESKRNWDTEAKKLLGY